MPDGSIRKMQYLSAIDSFRPDGIVRKHQRRVLEGIGFMEGSGFGTHEWYIDGPFCDQWTCFPKHLRCFENDSVHINFLGFPCDRNFSSSTYDIDDQFLEVSPNPTDGQVIISSDLDIEHILIFTVDGSLILDQKYNAANNIELPEVGVYFLKARVNEQWVSKKIVRIN